MDTPPAQRRYVAVDPEDRSIRIEHGPTPSPRPGEV